MGSDKAQVVLLATSNLDKLREITAILGDLPLTFKTLADFPAIDVPEETGSTFAENARQKALYYAQATALLTVAEDSGFEVDALNGQPGIHSARYLGADATYQERFEVIYRDVSALGATRSAARYVSAVAVASGSKIVFETRGVVEGELAARPAGTGGFGYDPIFTYPPYGKTFGEVSDTDKAAVSHRGLAMRNLRNYLS